MMHRVQRNTCGVFALYEDWNLFWIYQEKLMQHDCRDGWKILTVFDVDNCFLDALCYICVPLGTPTSWFVTSHLRLSSLNQLITKLQDELNICSRSRKNWKFLHISDRATIFEKKLTEALPIVYEKNAIYPMECSRFFFAFLSLFVVEIFSLV